MRWRPGAARRRGRLGRGWTGVCTQQCCVEEEVKFGVSRASVGHPSDAGCVVLLEVSKNKQLCSSRGVLGRSV